MSARMLLAICLAATAFMIGGAVWLYRINPALDDSIGYMLGMGIGFGIAYSCMAVYAGLKYGWKK